MKPYAEMSNCLLYTSYAANGRHFYGITGFIRGFLKNRRLERRYEQALKGKTAPEDKTEPNVGNPWSKAHPQLLSLIHILLCRVPVSSHKKI